MAARPAIAGSDAASVMHQPFTVATSNPPSDENACVYPSTFSRRFGSVNSSASHATAATNSTQTPMNTKQRSTSSI